jgi:hypothetical protein
MIISTLAWICGARANRKFEVRRQKLGQDAFIHFYGPSQHLIKIMIDLLPSSLPEIL